jgi:archaellum component FlaF (FlaF/FlaG flagellin family)
MSKVKSVLVIMLLVFGASLVSADNSQEKVENGQLFITDGRVNSWDVAAPAVVYCTFSDTNPTDASTRTFEGIKVLRVNAENNGELAFNVSAAKINSVGATPATDTLLEQADGISLYRAHTGEFYLTAPQNDGKTYTFTWKAGDQNC